jgi:DNA excision repair protein ERCC-6
MALKRTENAAPGVALRARPPYPNVPGDAGLPDNGETEDKNSLRSRLRKNPRKTEHFITMGEAVDHLTDSVRNLIILPPDTGDRQCPTDEEDFGDDPEDVEMVEVAGEVEVEHEEAQDSEDDEDDAEEASRWRKHTLFDHQWPPADPFIPLDERYPVMATKSEFEVWCEIFDNEILQLIREQSLLYAHRDKVLPLFSLSEEDLLKFLGIIIFSGYHRVPGEFDYWSNQPDLKVPLIAETMTRDRFREIKSCIHLMDNHALPPGDKMAKVSRLFNLLNNALQRFGIFHEDLSIDESMVPYHGRHSAKMFIKGKPIRFGYKIWTLTGQDGFPYKSILYQGKERVPRSEPLGSHVVNSLLSVVEPGNHNIFFDNFFTSHALMVKLQEDGHRATGTIRGNRTNGAAQALLADKALTAKGRGEYDFRCDGKVFIVKWNDSAVVHVASNHLTHEPLGSAKRRVKLKTVNVPQPFLVKRYNEGMGGVDLMDRLLGAYRPSIRGKKWWWPLFLHAVNMSVVAAWRLYCNLHPDNKGPSHLDFRRTITLCLLKGTSPARNRILGGHHAHLPADVRYDGLSHESVPTSQGRCVFCSANTRSMCAKCGVRLHYSRGTTCFSLYHTRP